MSTQQRHMNELSGSVPGVYSNICKGPVNAWLGIGLTDAVIIDAAGLCYISPVIKEPNDKNILCEVFNSPLSPDYPLSDFVANTGHMCVRTPHAPFMAKETEQNKKSHQKQSSVRVKKERHTLTYSEMISVSHKTAHNARESLGMTNWSFRKQCRRLGVTRWKKSARKETKRMSTTHAPVLDELLHQNMDEK